MRGNAPIVVGVDDSEQALQAVRWAAAAAAHRHAPLRILHATGFRESGPAVLYSARLRTLLQETGEQLLQRAAEAARQTAEVDVDTELSEEPPAIALLEAAPTSRMLVVGSHRGFADALLGSTAVQVVAHADAPVVVVRGRDADRRTERDPVVIGVDGSPLSEKAVEHAFEEAALRGAPLIALIAWAYSESSQAFSQATAYFDFEPIRDTEDRLLAERLAGWGEKYPDVVVERRVVLDRPRHALIGLSKSAQLVVVGSRGRGGFSGLLLGSTSQALIHHAACPVMVVRPQRADE